MAQSNIISILESCAVAPPPNSVGKISVPLTFFDVPFLHCPLIHHIFFNECSNSISHFTDKLIPKFKDSLSLTLKNYYPLSGNLIIPCDASKPKISYVPGNSVSLVFAKSNQDFSLLTSNRARNCDNFYLLVPKLPLVSSSSDTLIAPLLAVQVTLFPNSGICTGFTFRRAAADGNAFHGFIRSFASMLKAGNDKELSVHCSSSSYDRNLIKVNDPNELDKMFWSQVRKKEFQGSQPNYVPTNKVRATFIMHQKDVQRLRKLVVEKFPNLHISTFTLTCAYAWTCMIKSRQIVVKKIEENDLDHFLFSADSRALLVHPVPANYFGNCLINCLVKAKTTDLIQENGFFIAAELIGKIIREKLQNNNGPLLGAEKWVEEIEVLDPERVVGVAGSPKFAVYDMDFGWGKPKKSEVISIDATGSISLNECRDFKGDLEVGLSLPEAKMEAFAAIFADGLDS